LLRYMEMIRAYEHEDIMQRVIFWRVTIWL